MDPIQSMEQFNGNEIAVVGMAGRFPGADTIETFWHNLRQGVESIKFFTEPELREAGVDPQRLTRPNFVGAAGHLAGSDRFDAGFFGFSPMDAAVLDPQHRVFLEVAWETLEDACYDPATYPGTIGVFAGSGANAYLVHNLLSNPDLVESRGFFNVWTNGNDKDFLASRLSYLLNLRGPSLNVQTACSTSLVAVHLAVQSLLNGECDLALAGGVTILLPQQLGYLYREGEIMSPDGHCRAFDAKAGGTVFGSGAGVVALKRLEEAIREGDNIHAVIRGSAINNDGSTKVGYTAPSVPGQAEVITEALAVAGVSPDTISYVEAHGTGTPMGDPIEVAALTRAFRSDTDRRGFCAIGSLKTNIGHLDSAAGVANLIKAALALKHRELPPSLNFASPNPEIDFASSPFYVNSQLAPWPGNGLPRRAGVSSLGVGGTNAHLVLEEAPDPGRADRSRSHQLLLISARSAEALDQATGQLADHLERHPDPDLADVAHSLQVGRRSFPHRRFLVCERRDEAARALADRDPERLLTRVAPEEAGKVVFAFPGQGTQYVNMGRDLYRTEETFRQQVDRCAELLRPHLGLDLRELLYPPPEQEAEAAARLEQTALTQPAVFVIGYALARLWQEWGIHPEAMIGHSVGEFLAACLAGTISLEEVLPLIAVRGRLMQELPGGSMLGVSLPEAELLPRLGEDLSLAAVNSPDTCVVSGPEAAVSDLADRLTSEGINVRPLHTSHAFHSRMMQPAVAAFTREVGRVNLRPPQIPFISCLTGTWITPRQATDPAYWASQFCEPVRFSAGIRTLLQEPDRVLLEVGPGNTLSTLARQHRGDDARQLTALPSLRRPNDLEQQDLPLLLETLGRLWQSGAPVDWSGFYARERRRRISLPTYPFQRQRYWIQPGQPVQYADASADPGLARKPDLNDWFYLPSWTRKPLPTPESEAASAAASDGWLLLAHPEGFGSRMAQTLAGPAVLVHPGEGFRQTDPDTYTIDPRQPQHYEMLLQALAEAGRFPRRILHLWNLTAPAFDTQAEGDTARRLDRGFYSLLHLAQALGKQQRAGPVRIGVVSNGMQQVAGEPLSCPEKAPLLGPVRVIPREFPGVTCCSLDVPVPLPHSWQETRLFQQLVAELSAENPDPVVAYRGHQRWVQEFQFQPLDLAGIPEEGLLKEGGAYLITGGLGALGLFLAEGLAKSWRANLALISRRGLPPAEERPCWLADHGPADPTSQRIARVQALEQAGARVLVMAADVGNPAQLRQAVQQARDCFGTIDGVIHAAGVLADGAIQLKTRETADSVLTPKVRGTLALAEALTDLDLDFLALFSSTSALLGTAGQVDYVGANAFLDAWAARESATGRYTLSINWGPWQEAGMAAEAAARATANRVPPAGEPARPFDHPLLDRWRSDAGGGESFLGVCHDSDWAVDEHRIAGRAVLPGVTHLELARAALAHRPGTGAMEIRDVFFVSPLRVKSKERRELAVHLRSQEDGGQFTVASGSGNGPRQEHVRGFVGYLDSAAPGRRSIPEIQARCQLADLTDPQFDQSEHVTFGPRWQNIKRVQMGAAEALLTIEIPEAFREEVTRFGLHPALLDMATGGAHRLIPGHDRVRDFYVPFSYGKVRMYAPLPPRIFSHIRYRADLPRMADTAVFDVTIMDEGGNILVEVSDYVVRRLADPASMISDDAPAYLPAPDAGAGVGDLPGDDAPAAGLEHGIKPEEGVEAFFRLLSRRVAPQVIVSPQDINALLRATAASASPPGSGASGEEVAEPAAGSLVQHPRPELANEYVAPATELERSIADIWQRVLGIGQIGVYDDFFELGGHSLMVVTIHDEVQKGLGVSFPVANTFQYPTVSALAGYLAQLQAATATNTTQTQDDVMDRAQRQREAQARRQAINRASRG